MDGWSFLAGWGSRDTLDVTLVEPEPVVVGVDVPRMTTPAALRRRQPCPTDLNARG